MTDDIVRNAEELLNIDLNQLLGGIRTERLGSVYYGKRAIAKDSAHLIGAMAAGGDWAMHDPPIVYLSAKLISDRVSGKEFNESKRELQESAADYGQKVLPNANLYMEVLDFLLAIPNRDNSRELIGRLLGLLRKGKIRDAYEIMRSRDDLVRRRG